MSHKPTAIDLFSGAGGLTEGLRQAGFRVVAAVESDALACSTYRMNHPEVHVCEGDIRRLSANLLMKKVHIARGDLDLLAACPPCQGFSRLRTKNGSKRNRDPQNNLIFEVSRFVEHLFPKAVMLENVPDLGGSTRLKRFISELRHFGYETKWRVLNTVHYAVPQRRRRLVLIAFSG